MINQHSHALRLIGTIAIIIFILASPPIHAKTSGDVAQQAGVALISAEEAGLAPMALTAGKEIYAPLPTLPLHFEEEKTNSARLAATNAEFVVEYVAADAYGVIQNPYPCATVPNDAKTAVEKALSIWKDLLNPPYRVPIKVQVCWSYLNDANILSLVKIPNYAYRFPNIPSEHILYPVSLANSLSGKDLDGITPEIAILINSRQAANFHYAVDTPGAATKYHFVSVFLHNVAHGLGFTSSFSVYKNSSGTMVGRWGVNIPGEGILPLSFDSQVTDAQNRSLTSTDLYPQNSPQLAQALQSNAVLFHGVTTRLANQGAGARIYAPATYSSADSIHHLDANYNSMDNFLMAPTLAKGQPFLLPGPLVKTMLLDIGWDVIVSTPAPPRRLLLSTSTFQENIQPESAVITLSSADPNPNDTFSYSLVSGSGSMDNAVFKIEGNKLSTAVNFDYEVKKAYDIRIRTTDAGGLFLEKTFTITVQNINEPPTSIGLTITTVPEGAPTNTLIGELSTVDPEGGIHSYSLNCPGANNNLVKISDAKLLTAAVLNYETNQELHICIKSTDWGGLSTNRYFTIPVGDINELPTTVTLLPDWVRTNVPANSRVGTLKCDDPDIGDTCTYSLPAGMGDNELYKIHGTEILTATAVDRALGQTYTISILAVDKSNQGPVPQEVVITVREPVVVWVPLISR